MDENKNQYQELLFSIAYNMLGAVQEAEDVVQEAYLKFYEAKQSDIQAPKNYLVKIVTNLAVNKYKNVKRQRTDYYGVWLPEPLSLDEYQFSNENDDTILNIGLLKVLENLNPVERAVFILKGALDFEYESIANFLETSVENCRKLQSRARKKVNQKHQKALNVDPEKHQHLLEALQKALMEGDHQQLKDLFHQDIQLYSDGGGKKVAALKPLFQRKYVLRFLTGIQRNQQGIPSLQWTNVNGMPGIAIYMDSALDSVWTLETNGSQITGLYIQRNPDKLDLIKKIKVFGYFIRKK